MNIRIAVTSLESQRPVWIAHMPGVKQCTDENSKGEEEGLCSTQKSSWIVFGVVLWQVMGQLWDTGNTLWSVFYWSSDAQGEIDEAFFRQQSHDFCNGLKTIFATGD